MPNGSTGKTDQHLPSPIDDKKKKRKQMLGY